MQSVSLSGLKSSEIQAVIIRADGTREDLGTIAYWHSNPLKRAWFAVKQFFKEAAHG